MKYPWLAQRRPGSSFPDEDGEPGAGQELRGVIVAVV